MIKLKSTLVESIRPPRYGTCGPWPAMCLPADAAAGGEGATVALAGMPGGTSGAVTSADDRTRRSDRFGRAGSSARPYHRRRWRPTVAIDYCNDDGTPPGWCTHRADA